MGYKTQTQKGLCENIYFFFLKANKPQLSHIKWKMINVTYFKNQQRIYNSQEEEISLFL